jgi:hypothetical protein
VGARLQDRDLKPCQTRRMQPRPDLLFLFDEHFATLGQSGFIGHSI